MHRVVVALSDTDRALALADTIESHPLACDVELACVTDVEDLESRLGELGPIDVLFVDTASNPADEGTGGIDFVARCFPEGCATQVVYVTRSLEHVSAAYRTQHAFLIADPVTPQAVADAFEACVRVLRSASNRPFGVRSDGKIQVVYPQRILYIESDRRKLHIHMGGEVLTIYATLDAISQNLPDSFVRCHKSFLVNMRCIESMDAHHITLFTGETVPVSQKRRKPTHDAFVAYMDAVL